MKNNIKTQITLNKIFQRIFIIMLLIINSHFMDAQLMQSLGAQSNTYGNPYQEAAFSIPTIQGVTTICNGQTTALSVDTGYSSYYWSNGNTTSSTTVGAGSYTITVTDALGCTRSNSITVLNDPCGLALNLTCFIEGYYLGANLMAPVLMNEGIGANLNVTDTIEVELRNQNAPYNLIASNKTELNTNGTSSINFNANAGTYYIAVKHRNALYTWSSVPVTFSIAAVNYDFTNAVNKAYGNNMIEVETGTWAFYSGELNNDENIDLLDLSNLESDINNFLFGYYATDLNGDANVDLLDTPVLEANVNSFIFSSHP